MSELEPPVVDQEEYASQLFFRLRLETLAAVPAFDELLEFASQTCLREPDAVRVYEKEIEQLRQYGTEQQMLHHFGNWGLRAALELQECPDTFFDRTIATDENGDEKPDHEQPFSIHSLLNYPRSLYLEQDPVILNKIEAFGRAVVEESFTVLGSDAPKMVEDYKKAGTEQEKLQIIEWLLKRIIEIRDHKPTKQTPDEEEVQGFDDNVIRIPITTSSDQSGQLNEAVRIIGPEVTGTETNDATPEDKNYYHPARLSPKLIGAYPNVNLSPTCLGLSILAASFFEKAGVPYFHAGVMQSAQELGRYSQILSISIMRKAAEKWDTRIPDHIDQKLTGLETELRTLLDNNRGHHAAIIIRTDPKRWAVLDPNYRSNSYFYPEEMDRLEQLYDIHNFLRAISPGTEHALCFEEAYQIGMFAKVMDLIKEADIEPGEIDKFIDLAAASAEPLEVFKQYLLFFLTRREGFDFGSDVAADSGPLDILFDDYIGKRIGFSWRGKIEYINRVMEEVLKTYVFPDADGKGINDCVKRCQVDQAYRQRRKEDLKFAPLYLVYKMHKEFVDEVDGMNIGHAKMEIGLPHYRIGMCVLSDYAVYGGDALPPSFWATYWPSHTVFTDHIAGREMTDSQKTVAWNLFSIINSGTLRYTNSDGIIDKFLEQEGDVHVTGE